MTTLRVLDRPQTDSRSPSIEWKLRLLKVGLKSEPQDSTFSLVVVIDRHFYFISCSTLIFNDIRKSIRYWIINFKVASKCEHAESNLIVKSWLLQCCKCEEWLFFITETRNDVGPLRDCTKARVQFTWSKTAIWSNLRTGETLPATLTMVLSTQSDHRTEKECSDRYVCVQRFAKVWLQQQLFVVPPQSAAGEAALVGRPPGCHRHIL